MEPRIDKKIIIAGVVVVLAVALGVWGFSTKNPASTGGQGGTGTTEVKGGDAFRPDNAEALATVEGGTREAVKTEIKTPGVGETGLSADIAIPLVATPVGEGRFDFRKFTMKGEGGKFVPSTVVVNAGDVVKIDFTAVDADYNFSAPDFGVNLTIKKGETKSVDFQPYDFGQYKFSCAAGACAGTAEGLVIANQR